ncbi:Nitrogenase component 1 type Oxidoreductase [Ruminococcus sp. YE71]|uniref:nitrogenase component 1 n=1 Tax=unclassified Ruminococcus TaxID=2608920 RepID=UPI00088D8C84|nr:MULTISPECIES: nitrogenase component 1 [unclassified Ruminococcus]SDA12072.1 Nitrogenase component 1 type Oxidoreductase [Ruminococcus sp. YE78]SFW16200.1 Nitrogenase component 1 type Oxidoreductase [Ruminococcus sp. YE71]
MSTLLKHISPLAPDDSGACSVLYEMGGIVVICDAGGCAGNVCGFDEPRWHCKRSALFSAGLRDMDAILGRDDRLVEKLVKVTGQVEADFTAIIGTPVPAVIATDYHALERMSERRSGLPCIALPTDGTRLYDYGEELAYTELFRRFAEEGIEPKKGKLGIIGATPLNTGLMFAEKLIAAGKAMGFDEVVCFGLDSGLDEVKRAAECERLLVISPSGVKAAEYLNKRFGTPFEAGYPCLPEAVCESADGLSGKKVLVINQQFAANTLREKLKGCEVDCATWFALDKRYAHENDFRIKDEGTLRERIEQGGYDVIFADRDLWRAMKYFGGELIDFPHYAVSATLA